jgi:TonB family protein
MTTAPIRSDWVGRIVDGKFTLRQWLGGSERSDVFLTELEGEGSPRAALKLIPADAGDAESRVPAWAAATALSHPHLVRIFDAGRCEIDTVPLLYVVTEYAGEVLSEILPERPLTPAETREMLGPVLDALCYLQGKGFVHGRLKPSNILVIDDQLKLSSDSLVVAGAVSQRPEAPEVYDPPEGATDPISPAADVWSLGATIVEALTQNPPVWSRSTQSVPVVPPSLPQPFLDIAVGCLHHDPQRRFTLNDVMARLLGVQSLPAVQPVPRVQPVAEVQPVTDQAHRKSAELERKPTGPAPARPRIPVLGVAVLVLLVVAVGLVLRSHNLETDSARQRLAHGSPSDSAAGDVIKGAVVERSLPDLLPEAQESIHGQFTVKVRVTVDSDGNVSNAGLDFAGPSKYFARQALEAGQQWKFKPAQRKGQPVSSVWTLEFRFTQAGTEVTPVEVSP